MWTIWTPTWAGVSLQLADSSQCSAQEEIICERLAGEPAEEPGEEPSWLLIFKRYSLKSENPLVSKSLIT